MKRWWHKIAFWLREFCWSLFFWPQGYEEAVEEAVRVMAGGEDD